MQPSWRLFILIFVFSSFGMGVILIGAGLIIHKLPLIGIGILCPLIVGLTYWYLDRRYKRIKNL